MRWSPLGSLAPGATAALRSGLALALTLFLTAPAGAQAIPAPLPHPVLLPATPLGRGLSGAYGALLSASAANPAGAARAYGAYLQALARARAGDVMGALSAAHIAQAVASSPSSLGPQASSSSLGPQPSSPAAPPQGPLSAAARPGENATGVFPSTAGVPIAENGVPLSPDLLAAKQEIDLAGEISPAHLEGAKAHYRAALDAYVSGNGERSRKEALAALDAAADAISTVK